MSFEVVGQTLNGWIAALGGVAVVLALSSISRAWHEAYVRRMLRAILREQRKRKVLKRVT